MAAFLPGVARPLAALGAALLLVALVLALANVRGLELGALRPARGPVGARLALALPLATRARLARPRALVIALAEEAGDAPSPAGFVAGLTRERTTVALAWRPRRRGRVERLWIFVTGGDACGLWRVTRAFELAADVLVLPRRGRLLRPPEPRTRPQGSTRGRPGPGEEELDHVRDWRAGESLHRVHWRLSARRGRPILRELRAPAEGPVELLLRTAQPARGLARTRGAAFERAVSLAATLVDHYLRHGRRLVLSIEGQGSVPGLAGRAGLARALGRLALVQPTPGTAEPVHAEAQRVAPVPARRARRRRPASDPELVVVLAGGAEALAPALARRARVYDVEAPRGHPHHAQLLGAEPGGFR
ncbi:MAG TPA: DUF58 domain-containing protein [Planctomycetota bacterium]